MKIILGSQSKGRRQVLLDAGIDFDTVVADIDEKAIRSDDYTELPLLVAHGKADYLASTVADAAILITADTVVVYDGELREKPISAEEARAFLKSYTPDTPALVNTGIVVTNLATGRRVDGFGQAAVYFKTIPDEVIEQAIADGYIFGCAGAFAIETEILAPYVDRYEGEHSAVVGLPLKKLQQLLSEIQS